MKIVKCDMCTELIGDFQLEVLQVGDRNYDLHRACASKLKEMLRGSGEIVLKEGLWTSSPVFYPSYPAPYVPPVWPNSTFTPAWPNNNPTVTCTNAAGELRV